MSDSSTSGTSEVRHDVGASFGVTRSGPAPFSSFVPRPGRGRFGTRWPQHNRGEPHRRHPVIAPAHACRLSNLVRVRHGVSAFNAMDARWHASLNIELQRLQKGNLETRGSRGLGSHDAAVLAPPPSWGVQEGNGCALGACRCRPVDHVRARSLRRSLMQARRRRRRPGPCAIPDSRRRRSDRGLEFRWRCTIPTDRSTCRNPGRMPERSTVSRVPSG